MIYLAPFTYPFILGAAFLFLVVAWKYILWLCNLPKEDIKKIKSHFFSAATLYSFWEIFRECLLHVRIFKRSRRLGYMHSSLAFGWFMLIVIGWIETMVYLGISFVPLYGHVFFRFFSAPVLDTHIWLIDFLMDFFLLVVLSGVFIAWFKRLCSRLVGIRRTTKHVLTDKMAMSFLWFIFPLRLLAESVTSSIYGGGAFLTGSLGAFFGNVLPFNVLEFSFMPLWWCYSISLGGFFVFMPFSRYMHIFTEIPLVFLRNWKLKPDNDEKYYDKFEIQACSRCGICIDPCQLQKVLGIDNVQSVYFLRDKRYHMLRLATAQNCLMCGRCQQVCPVGINLNTLRLSTRVTMRNLPSEQRYKYFENIDRSSGEGRVGYFAGCMTHLTPKIKSSMERIFAAASEQVWWADRDGSVCCGRPLMLSGEKDAAMKMIAFNKELFVKHQITTLVTSCPICFKVFSEQYHLDGIKVLHHSQYIASLLEQGRIKLSASDLSYVYHDPCELGRGCGIYDEPRNVLRRAALLKEAPSSRENALCCGGSLANTFINDYQQQKIASSVVEELTRTGADRIATACPLCRKTLSRCATRPVMDIAEIVSERLL